MKTQEQTGTKERVTICLEKEQLETLDKVVKAVGYSRSCFVALLIDRADLNALIMEYEQHGGSKEKA